MLLLTNPPPLRRISGEETARHPFSPVLHPQWKQNWVLKTELGIAQFCSFFGGINSYPWTEKLPISTRPGNVPTCGHRMTWANEAACPWPAAGNWAPWWWQEGTVLGDLQGWAVAKNGGTHTNGWVEDEILQDIVGFIWTRAGICTLPKTRTRGARTPTIVSLSVKSLLLHSAKCKIKRSSFLLPWKQAKRKESMALLTVKNQLKVMVCFRNGAWY